MLNHARSLSLVPLLALRLFAQHEAPDTFGHSRHGGAFDEGPRQAAYLMPGMSDQVRFPVAGLSDEAQRFFDQGITQLHGFWYFESERSFRQVAKLFPDCAMAYWGMAMANVESPERAAGLIANAVRRSADLPANEQAWIDAYALYYQIDDAHREALRSGDAARIAEATKAVAEKNKERKKELKEKLDRQLIKDLGTIVFEHPEHTEAKALLAVQIWLAYGWGSGIPIVSHSAVDALLEQVFQAAPLHPAHHYRIHLWDQEDGKRALDSAAKNGSSAPGIAHQWHMSGHIYAKLHRHAEAAWQQEASSRVDHAHMMRDRVMPFLIHNYGHNQEWLARSLSHQGRVEEALTIAKNLAELPRHPKWNRVAEGGEIARYARQRLVQITEDHGLWAEALELCEHGFLEESDDVGSEVERLGLRGRALFRLGRVDEGKRVVADAQALLTKARQKRAAAIDAAEDEAFAKNEKRDAMRKAVEEAGRRPSGDVEGVLDLLRELKGEQLLAEGDAKAALAEFEAIRGMPLVLLNDARLAAGEVDKAVEALEKENEKNPNRVPTMLALERAYEAKAAPEQQEKLSALREQLVRYRGKPGPGLRLKVPGDDAVLFTETEHDVASFGADFGPRPALSTLGPRTWSPVANPGFELPGIGGEHVRLAASGDGRAKLVVFYLGFGCLHCVEQLHALRPKAAEFAALGVDVVAIGSDTLARTEEAHRELKADERMPFPMLADPTLAAFRGWRCYDDFEGMALHGTFLVDGQGLVRWQDISYEPFMEIDWLLGEARRLLALPVPADAR